MLDVLRSRGDVLLVVVWAAGLVSSCASRQFDDSYVIETVFDPCRVAVLVAADVRPEEAEALDQALRHWNVAAELSLEAVQDATELASDQVVPVVFQDAAGPFRGYYDDAVGAVYINRRLNHDAQALTVAHELGHAFGLLHVDPRAADSVMNPGRGKHMPLPLDVENLRALWPPCDQPRPVSSGDAGVAEADGDLR